ncbi:MAG: hypothetical protein ABFD79_08245 [Phycisphaerales bacterium]
MERKEPIMKMAFDLQREIFQPKREETHQVDGLIPDGCLLKLGCITGTKKTILKSETLFLPGRYVASRLLIVGRF